MRTGSPKRPKPRCRPNCANETEVTSSRAATMTLSRPIRQRFTRLVYAASGSKGGALIGCGPRELSLVVSDIRERQANDDGRAGAELAVDVDRPVTLVDDAIDRRETEAGALVLGLGAEERLEQM